MQQQLRWKEGERSTHTYVEEQPSSSLQPSYSIFAIANRLQRSWFSHPMEIKLEPSCSSGEPVFLAEVGREDQRLYKPFDSLMESEHLLRYFKDSNSRDVGIVPSVLTSFHSEVAKKYACPSTNQVAADKDPNGSESCDKQPKLNSWDQPMKQPLHKNVSTVYNESNIVQNRTRILEQSQQQHHQLQGQNGKEIYEIQGLQYAQHMQQPQQYQAHPERLHHQLLPLCPAGTRQQWPHGPLVTPNAQNSAKEMPLSSSESVDNRQNVHHYSMEKMEDPPPSPSKFNHAKDHILAERKRREKLSQRFIALAAMLPGLKKMDKATILGDAVKMVKQLQEKLVMLEQRASKEGPTVVKSSEGGQLLGDDAGIHSSINDSALAGGLRDIEVRVAGKNVFVRLHCEKIKGMLVKVISELESLHMSVAHANVLSFSESALDLTLTAQMEEGYEVTVDYIIKYLHDFLDRLK